MSKNKNEKVGPGLESTLFVDLSIINEMALSFAKVAIEEFGKIHYGNTLDVRKYTYFTNGALALELFFKSFNAKRKLYPSYMRVNNEEEITELTETEYYSETGVVAIHHSTIEIPNNQRTHELDKLFMGIPDKEKKAFLDYVYNVTPSIKNEQDFDRFISDIKLYFVEKRYPFEDFQFSVPADNAQLRILHYVLLAMISFIENYLGIKI